ncbi:hypothetical protein A9Q99_15565 [Gammaproteobacteria bacterium 45_16_T64]|nr:hypothetical protein A9Q99_15565 [Gammaproteobacteria bacterium 45_16_T64]
MNNSEERYYGTSPIIRDTDGDSIPDGIESKVVGPLALVGLGVTPLHKDILLEIDWIASNEQKSVSPIAVSQ